MQILIRCISLFLVSTLFSACGNKVENVSFPYIREQLSLIEVVCNEDTMGGTNFTHHLNMLLATNTSIKPKYRLEVGFNVTGSPLALQSDSEILRETIQQVVSYRLYELPRMTLIYSNSFRQLNSYNTLFSPYSAYISEEKVRIDLSRSAANELRNKLIMYFNKKKISEMRPTTDNIKN